MEWPAHSWNVCRRNFEQAQRMWIHSLWPLLSFTGAIPLKFWTWLALENRSRLGPKAAIRRGTITSGTGQGVEYGAVGMRFRQGPNALVQVGYSLVEHADDLAHPMRQDDAGFEHGLVARCRDGFAN